MGRTTIPPIGLLLAGTLIACVLAGDIPCATAATSSVPGTAATIDPLDDFGKTIDDQVIETWVKVLGVVLIVGGALGMLRVPTLGVLGVVAGLLIIFANPIIEATFTTTSAAPLMAPPSVTATVQVPLALRPVLVLLFYPMQMLRLLQDFTFWAALALSAPIVRGIRSWSASGWAA